jgi:hypothetical protein
MTSRGIAIADVDYGSTAAAATIAGAPMAPGASTSTTVAAARFLVERGDVDPTGW